MEKVNEVFLKKQYFWYPYFVENSFASQAPYHMAGRQVIRNREEKIGFRNFLPSWYTFRTFCLRSQILLVQKQIAAIEFFHIISRETKKLNMDPPEKTKTLNLSHQ